MFSPRRKGGGVTLKLNRCFRRRIGVSAPAGAEGAGRLRRAGRAGGCARGQPRQFPPAPPGRFGPSLSRCSSEPGLRLGAAGWAATGRARQPGSAGAAARGRGQERTPAVRVLTHVEITGGYMGDKFSKINPTANPWVYFEIRGGNGIVK